MLRVLNETALHWTDEPRRSHLKSYARTAKKDFLSLWFILYTPPWMPSSAFSNYWSYAATHLIFTSQPGQGTQFRLAIPAGIAHIDTIDNKEPAKAEHIYSARHYDFKALIVDDTRILFLWISTCRKWTAMKPFAFCVHKGTIKSRLLLSMPVYLNTVLPTFWESPSNSRKYLICYPCIFSTIRQAPTPLFNPP